VRFLVAGLARPGEGLLIVKPVAAGEESIWTWEAIHRFKGKYVVTRRAGTPWPAITARPEKWADAEPERGVSALGRHAYDRF